MRRKMLSMSQKELSDALALTFQQVHKYEKGTNRIGAVRLQQISNILKIPVSFFFEGAPDITESDDTGGRDDLFVSDFLSSSEGLRLLKRIMAWYNERTPHKNENTEFEEDLVYNEVVPQNEDQEEGDVQDPRSDEILDLYLASVTVPTAKRAEVAREIRKVIARSFDRPKWLGRQERGGKLAILTAPLFLKQVYFDQIGEDGTISKDVIRDLDADLMGAVETYISQRKRRGLDLGDAGGLVFTAERPATAAKSRRRARPELMS